MTVLKVTGVAAIAAALFGSVGSPYAIAKQDALQCGDWSKIAKSSFEFAAYDNPRAFALDYACHHYLRKLDVPGDEKRLHNEAIQSFLAVEERMKRVNSQLKYSSCKNGVEGIISDARRKIESILGELSLSEFAQGCGWGPGASATLKGAESTRDKKLLEPRLGVTRRAQRYARAYLENSALWIQARLGHQVIGPVTLLPQEYSVCEDGRYTTVPKDINRRRSIDVQPTLNLFLQKGVGKMIRSRLKRHGIDLNDQSRNQRLAAEAYTAGYATIDLEAASDSVSTELVRLLLPSDWFELLDDLRTRSIYIDGRSHRLEKFSAMGNGFTFELESLIFYALSWGVVRCEALDHATPIAVYGDDIVISNVHSERLMQTLVEVGFVVNDQKSFTKGPFYESCGKHYYEGIEVTPPIQKEEVGNTVALVRCANRLWRWAHRMGAGVVIDDVARNAYEYAAKLARISFHEEYGVGQRRKVSRQLPEQPWWLEGDGGLIVNKSFPRDINGIARLDLFKVVTVGYTDYTGALYGDTLREMGELSDTQRYIRALGPRRNVVGVLSNVGAFGPLQTAVRVTKDVNVQRCYQAGMSFFSDGRPSKGLVTPRSVEVWKIDKQRVYCKSSEVPEFASLTS